jgi:hypothetical protein
MEYIKAIKDLVKQNSCYDFNEDNFLISSKSTHTSSSIIRELVTITSALTKLNIRFIVIDEFNIQLEK